MLFELNSGGAMVLASQPLEASICEPRVVDLGREVEFRYWCCLISDLYLLIRDFVLATAG